MQFWCKDSKRFRIGQIFCYNNCFSKLLLENHSGFICGKHECGTVVSNSFQNIIRSFFLVLVKQDLQNAIIVKCGKLFRKNNWIHIEQIIMENI